MTYPIKICDATKQTGVMCPLRRSCQLYKNLLELAETVSIRKAVEDKVAERVPVEFTSVKKEVTCIHFKTT